MDSRNGIVLCGEERLDQTGSLRLQAVPLLAYRPEWNRLDRGATMNEEWNSAVRTCQQFLLDSPTYQKHKQLCWCEMCAYVRGNVTEMNNILRKEEKS